MHRQLSTILAFLIAAVSNQNVFAIDEALEPTLGYTIKIGDKIYPTEIDKQLSLKGTFKNPSISISASSFKHFSYGGLAFNYPAYFTWEAEISDPSYKNWTLSGNDFKIMYFRMSHSFTPEAYAASMLKDFKGTEPKLKERVFSDVNLSGVSFAIDIGGNQIFNEAYAINLPKGSGLLVFQDSPSKGANLSKEGERTLSVLEKSFALLRS